MKEESLSYLLINKIMNFVLQLVKKPSMYGLIVLYSRSPLLLIGGLLKQYFRLGNSGHLLPTGNKTAG